MAFVENVAHVRNIVRHSEPPPTEASVRVDGINPSLSRSSLHLAKRVIALGLENEIERLRASDQARASRINPEKSPLSAALRALI